MKETLVVFLFFFSFLLNGLAFLGGLQSQGSISRTMGAKYSV
jgi:hypothetical protein